MSGMFVRTTFCPAYCGTDIGTGRLRTSVEVFRRHRLKVNSVVRVVLLPSRQELLCTAWPDSYQALAGASRSDGSTSPPEVCVDDVVSKGPAAAGDTHYEIAEVYAPRSASSYFLEVSPTAGGGAQTADKQLLLQDVSARMIGLPLAAGFSVAVADGLHTECEFVSPSGVCVVRTSSVQLRTPPESVAKVKQPRPALSSSSVQRSSGAVAVTTALQTIIDSVVVPVSRLHTERRDESAVSESEESVDGPCTPARATPSVRWDLSPASLAPPAQERRLVPEGGGNPERVIGGLLLSGPPGVGKTHSLRALSQLRFEHCSVSVEEIRLRDMLTADDGVTELMLALAAVSAPNDLNLSDPSKASLVLVLLDEVDSLGRGDGDSEVQHLIKHYLCKWMDTVRPCSKAGVYHVVVATTNRPGDVDPQLRTGSRLAKEINFLNSSQADKEQLLQSILATYLDHSSLRVPGEDRASLSAHLSPRLGGYAAADIALLVGDALRTLVQAPSMSLTQCFEEAYAGITPSCLRSNVIAVPRVTYEDVVGHEHAKQCFQRALSYYEKSTGETYKRFGLTAPGGILLYGPPGNSKTRLVLAAAYVHGLPVISLSGADVYSAFVGGAEAEIRRAFSIARQAQPCILFMDELDTLVANRGTGGSTGDISVESRVLATLLNEMDGIDGPDSGIVVVGTSNRVDSIDPALLRKGRLGQLVEMKGPNRSEAAALLKYFAEKYKLEDSVRSKLSAEVDLHFNAVFSALPPLSGAELRRRCQEAAMDSLRAVILSRTAPGMATAGPEMSSGGSGWAVEAGCS